MNAFLALVEQLPTVSLGEIMGEAELLTRTDRKYLLTPVQLDLLVEHLAAQPSVLQIEGRRAFAYRSVYFDTPAGASYLGAARSRPHRFKVRTRSYLDTGTAWVEVKVRDGRGRTQKFRQEHDPAAGDDLQRTDRAFVAGFPEVAAAVDDLRPVLATSYLRTTLVLAGTRATVDSGLRCATPDGRQAHIERSVVLETKSPHGAGTVDRALWSMGVRPAHFSKFGAGMATLHPALPHNKWHQALQRHPWRIDTDAEQTLRALTAPSQVQTRRCGAAARRHATTVVRLQPTTS